jgi:hypothetical protein
MRYACAIRAFQTLSIALCVAIVIGRIDKDEAWKRRTHGAIDADKVLRIGAIAMVSVKSSDVARATVFAWIGIARIRSSAIGARETCSRTIARVLCDVDGMTLATVLARIALHTRFVFASWT